jgi:23S rRNA (guanine2445-N2)-methyltransferase / 23S rRNA (guanine2069-N7)-methyltransferase
MNPLYTLFAPSAKNCSDLAAEEVLASGGEVVSVLPGGVSFRGSLDTIYRFSLYARVASSLVLTLGRFTVEDSDGLYRAASELPWSDLFPVEASIAVDASGKRERAVEHTGYAARLVKDAVADHFRERTGNRPSVDTENPQITIQIFLERKAVTIGLDLSGQALHRRGYRRGTGEAALRETVAAAALIRSGWKEVAEAGGTLFDPFCGSGTLLIEGALMAGSIAPGLFRTTFGFEMWKDHDEALWTRIREEAEQQSRKGLAGLPLIVGSDNDEAAISIAKKNIAAAGLSGHIRVSSADARFSKPPEGAVPGLLIADPPYGRRTTFRGGSLGGLYRSFGENLKLHFGGWQAAVIAGDEARNYRVGLKPDKVNTLFNGPVECSLALYSLHKNRDAGVEGNSRDGSGSAADLSPGAEMAANRLRKNAKRLKKWIAREGVTCYRLYDADMPEYSAALDIYETAEKERWIHLQEYAPPITIEPAAAARRLGELVDGAAEATSIPRELIVVKRRTRQRGKDQYQKVDERNERVEIHENGLRFLINLHDYLDTGIFLDHRPVRLRIMETAKGKRFLNLFAYTGTASVHAAAGGAKSTVTIDNSNTYLSWAGENFALNGFRADTSGRSSHTLIKVDCLKWLERAAEREKGRFDLIFLDPPTFSNSKDMSDVFDVQEDHPVLIGWCMELLAPGGELLFSTNRKNFKFQAEVPECRDITGKTIDPDFQNRRVPHQCWSIRK